jgi:hypothetical protein
VEGGGWREEGGGRLTITHWPHIHASNHPRGHSVHLRRWPEATAAVRFPDKGEEERGKKREEEGDRGGKQGRKDKKEGGGRRRTHNYSWPHIHASKLPRGHSVHPRRWPEATAAVRFPRGSFEKNFRLVLRPRGLWR